MTRPPFLADFAASLRYVLQQHERAVRARMRADAGEVGAIESANHYECLLEEGAQRFALVVLEQMECTTASRPSEATQPLSTSARGEKAGYGAGTSPRADDGSASLTNPEE